MPPVYYCHSEDCPRRKLRVQGSWRHEWCEPESTVVQEVVRGPFSKPLFVCSTPFVLLQESYSGRKQSYARTGIPDPWAECLAQQTIAHSQLGEENVAVLDNAYGKWGVPLCQGIPDPWRNRPYFLEASFEEPHKNENVSPGNCCKCLRKYGSIPPEHITRDYPRKLGNISTSEPTNCKCTPETSPQQSTKQPQLQPQLREKTPQTLYNTNREQICSCNLQQNVPLQVPSNGPQEKPRRKCPGCPREGRAMFRSGYCQCRRMEAKATYKQRTSTRSERKKGCCPISKCFRRSKKQQNERPNNNVTNQNYYPIAEQSNVPAGDGQNLLLMCWQNCKCNSKPCKLICTNVNLRDSGQVQVPLICQCSHTTGNSTNNTSNNSANLPSPPYNLPAFLPCPFDETTDSFEKKVSLDPGDTKFPPSQTKNEQVQVSEKYEPQKVAANKQASKTSKKNKVTYADKQNDTSDLPRRKDQTDEHVEDERNKGRL